MSDPPALEWERVPWWIRFNLTAHSDELIALKSLATRQRSHERHDICLWVRGSLPSMSGLLSRNFPDLIQRPQGLMPLSGWARGQSAGSVSMRFVVAHRPVRENPRTMVRSRSSTPPAMDHKESVSCSLLLSWKRDELIPAIGPSCLSQ